MPSSAAARRLDSSERFATATSSTPACRFRPGTCTELTMPPAPMMPTRIGLRRPRPFRARCASSAAGASAAATGSAADDKNSRRFNLKRRPELGLVAHVFPRDPWLAATRYAHRWSYVARTLRRSTIGSAEGGARMNERRSVAVAAAAAVFARRARAGASAGAGCRSAAPWTRVDARRPARSARHVGQLRQHAVRGRSGRRRSLFGNPVNPPAHWADHDSPMSPTRRSMVVDPPDGRVPVMKWAEDKARLRSRAPRGSLPRTRRRGCAASRAACRAACSPPATTTATRSSRSRAT